VRPHIGDGGSVASVGRVLVVVVVVCKERVCFGRGREVVEGFVVLRVERTRPSLRTDVRR
jgi:hypothetical protein